MQMQVYLAIALPLVLLEYERCGLECGGGVIKRCSERESALHTPTHFRLVLSAVTWPLDSHGHMCTRVYIALSAFL